MMPREELEIAAACAPPPSGALASPDFHPCQRSDAPQQVSKSVALRAYEVYCHLFREQPALITDGCRGGFGVGELIAFLYARSFPKVEWRARFDEALKGFSGLAPARSGASTDAATNKKERT